MSDVGRTKSVPLQFTEEDLEAMAMQAAVHDTEACLIEAEFSINGEDWVRCTTHDEDLILALPSRDVRGVQTVAQKHYIKAAAEAAIDVMAWGMTDQRTREGWSAVWHVFHRPTGKTLCGQSNDGTKPAEGEPCNDCAAAMYLMFGNLLDELEATRAKVTRIEAERDALRSEVAEMVRLETAEKYLHRALAAEAERDALAATGPTGIKALKAVVALRNEYRNTGRPPTPYTQESALIERLEAALGIDETAPGNWKWGD